MILSIASVAFRWPNAQATSIIIDGSFEVSKAVIRGLTADASPILPIAFAAVFLIIVRWSFSRICSNNGRASLSPILPMIFTASLLNFHSASSFTMVASISVIFFLSFSYRSIISVSLLFNIRTRTSSLEIKINSPRSQPKLYLFYGCFLVFILSAQFLRLTIISSKRNNSTTNILL